MGELATRQKQLWALICELADCTPMLRMSRTEDCFWVCDLPRRSTDPEPVKAALQAAGYRLWEDNVLRLWKIDLSDDDPLYHADRQVSTFPRHEESLQLYALWRMLAAHPSPFVLQPKPLLRRILKLCELPITEQNKQIKQITAECAARLNRKQPLPYAAAGILAMTIEMEEKL